MKKEAFAVTVALLLSAVAAGLCYAQPRVLTVNIPFAFQVGNKTLPAGHYQLETVVTGAGDYQLIRQENGDALTVVLATLVISEDRKSQPELIFNRYGQSHFLSQIWNGRGQGRQLLISKREKEVARGRARTEVAVLAH